jgi:membrane-associated HD superfamily phosphohydrolase
MPAPKKRETRGPLKSMRKAKPTMPKTGPAAKAAPKQYKSGANSDAMAIKNREAYMDEVQRLRETAETRKDVWDNVNLIAKAGKKYKQDPTKDIANWKKFVKKVTPKDANPNWK